MNHNVEQTLSIIKPDAVERNLQDKIKEIFSKNNLNILNSKKIQISKEEAEDGTLRKKYGISIDKNSVHGSDSVENAKKEIDFFFKD